MGAGSDYGSRLDRTPATLHHNEIGSLLLKEPISPTLFIPSKQYTFSILLQVQMKCIPEKIIDKDNALVCNFAQNPDAKERTARLSKTIKNVSTYVCDFHQKEENIPDSWK